MIIIPLSNLKLVISHSFVFFLFVGHLRADLWADIQNAPSACNFDECLTAMGITSTEYDGKNQKQLIEQWETRKKELKGAAGNDKSKNDKLNELQKKLNEAKERLENYRIIRDLQKDANENSLKSNRKILGVGEEFTAKQLKDAAKKRTDAIERMSKKEKLPTDKGAEADKAIDDVAKAVEKLKNYLKLTERANSDLNSQSIDSLIKLVARDEKKLLKADKMTNDDIKEAKKEVTDFIDESGNFPKGDEIDDKTRSAREKLNMAVKKLENYVKFRELLRKARTDTLEGHLDVLGGKDGLDWESMKGGEEERLEKRRDDVKKEFADSVDFPMDSDLHLATKAIETAFAKLKMYLQAREVATNEGDTLKDHAKKLDIEESELMSGGDTFSFDDKDLKERKKRRQRLLANRAGFPGDSKSMLEHAATKVDNSAKKMKRWLWLRGLSMLNKEDKLSKHMQIVGFLPETELKGLTKSTVGSKGEEQKKLLGRKADFPSDSDALLDKAIAQVDKSSEKLKNYVLARYVASPKDDTVKSHMRLVGFASGDDPRDLDPDALARQVNTQRKLFDDSSRDNFASDTWEEEVPKARKSIGSSLAKLEKYLAARKIATTATNEDTLGTHLEVLGFSPEDEAKSSAISEESVNSKAAERRKELSEPREFPSDANALREKAQKQVEMSAAKLRNFAKIRPILDIHGDKLADLLKILLPTSIGKEEEFTKEQLKTSAESMSAMAANLPGGMIQVKTKIDESYKKLKNYLKVRDRHLSKAETLDENLVVLGLEPVKRDSYEQRDIQIARDAAVKLPAATDDLPSDVPGIAKKVEEAAHRLENFLKVRHILNEAKENSLESNWAILGVVNDHDRGRLEKIEESAKERTKMVEKWVNDADAKHFPRDKLPEAEEAIKAIGIAKKKMHNYLRLTSLVNSDLDILPVDALIKLMSLEEAKPMLVESKMTSPEIEEAASKMVKEFIEDSEMLPKDIGGTVANAKKKLETLAEKLVNYVKWRQLLEKAKEGDTVEVHMEVLGQKLDKDAMTADDIGDGQERKKEFGHRQAFPAGIDLKSATDLIEASIVKLKLYARLRELASIKEDTLKAHAEKVGFDTSSVDLRKSSTLTLNKLKEQSKKQREFLAKNKSFPSDAVGILEEAKQQVEESTKKLEKFIWARDLAEQKEDKLATHLWITGFPRSIRPNSLNAMDIEKKAKEQKDTLSKKAAFPSDVDDILENGIAKVDKSSEKLKNYVLARDVASPKDDKLKTHLKLVGFAEGDDPGKIEEDALVEKASEQERKFIDESAFPGDAISEVKKAKKQIQVSLNKLRKYILARNISSLTGDKVEEHMLILGFASGDEPKSVELSEETIKSKAENRRKEFLMKQEFPEDADELRKKAKKQVDLSMEKLLNYARLRPISDITGQSIAELMKVLRMDPESAKKFTKAELEKARDSLVAVAVTKLPAGFDHRQKVDDAFRRLKNYLKVQDRHLSKAETLDENLVVLGIEPAKRDSYELRDIQNARAITVIFPKADELPSDVPDLRKKVEEAAKKLENNLLAREINKITGNTLADKWHIFGIVDAHRQASISQVDLKREFDKRKQMLRPVPSDVDGDLALEKLNDAFWELKEELTRRSSVAAGMKKMAEEGEKQSEGQVRERAEARQVEQRRPISEPDCRDEHPFCHLMSNFLCKNTHYMVSMQQSCRKSCGICVPSGQFRCEDHNKLCFLWNRNNNAFCDSSVYSKGMKLELCAKTCSLCPS